MSSGWDAFGAALAARLAEQTGAPPTCGRRGAVELVVRPCGISSATPRIMLHECWGLGGQSRGMGVAEVLKHRWINDCADSVSASVRPLSPSAAGSTGLK